MLRNGTLPCINHTGFDKIVHVGHSFGSAQSYALAAMYPSISDGLVLTGFSMNASFVGYFAAGADFQLANLNQPLRLGSGNIAAGLNYLTQTYGLTDLLAGLDLTSVQALDYANGYLVNSNVNSQQYLFFLPGSFDTGILYYGEQTKQPVTQGELFTLGSLPMMNTFAGPVLVFTGVADLPYCGGDCLATGGALPSVPAGVEMNFPNATAFEAYIQPGSGHGLNFHYNATGGYKYINKWLGSHGLAA
jgi:pimeloyl-ACP methyl ester carboxylesterase